MKDNPGEKEKNKTVLIPKDWENTEVWDSGGKVILNKNLSVKDAERLIKKNVPLEIIEK